MKYVLQLEVKKSMIKLLRKLFLESMLGAVIVISTIMFIGLIYLIPYLTKEKSISDAYSESERLTTYIRMFRSYYASDILKKVKSQTDLKVNFDHKSQDDTIPLPATLVHDLGAIFTEKTDTSIQMYSNYPFPNRSMRILDRFQQDALSYILKNPGKTFSREEVVNGENVYRTAFGDNLSAPSCVSCHNSRPDTPKNDWKLDDMRGVIEVKTPLHQDIGSNQNITYTILLFIISNFVILSIYYFLQIRRKNKKLEDDFTNKDKLLSEYKRAVDLGTIVSKSDKKGTITYVNDSFVDISGYSKKELIGNPHSMIRHPDMPSDIFKSMWKQILNKQVWQGDIKNRKKDGTDYHVHATIVPILDEKNEIVEFLAIRYDTTNLHDAIKRANIAEKTKGNFLANMSHELRTPLNAIIGFSQILQRRDKLDEKDASYISKIQLSGENLLTLVNSILDFSKIEEGEMEFYPTDINISELFKEINILLETQAKDKSIQISLHGFDDKHSIYADQQLLKQAFVNILSNAVKFTQENGSIKINYEYKNDQNHFSICDNGVGMSKQDLEELFKPFKQGATAKLNAAKGTGLGLAITKKIITEIHNGQISVESEEHKGTCFHISL